MRISVKNQLIILLSAAGLLTLLISLAVIFPTVRRILELERDITATERNVEKQYQRTQKLRRSTHEIGDVIALTARYRESMIEKGQELPVITELERLAAAHNIDQTLVVNFADKGAYLADPQYTFSFLNKGEFTDHIEYLRALEHLPYYMVINSLQWEKHDLKNIGQNPVTLRFDAEVYVKE